ncbi:G-protein-signaling modulator 2-like [Babylonia areolata]|uniref:G-protein-signaling modulator 2-like n=1 Tax=Babylonia areolata TaxID=304850 RepID=UPI003FD3A86A
MPLRETGDTLISTQTMSCTCMELALQGERLCKAGDCRAGVQFFEAAVQAGTDDLKTLGAIYSQLGNAYFYLQDYAKALEYHKHDLNLARTCQDRMGEAKASGNLGNTLKVIGKYDEAIVCCMRHLEISRELNDKVGEARALYNLGNVWHTKGKQMGRTGNQDPGEFPPQVKECLQKAAQFYQENLSLVKELGDKSAQGRACGNLGNTHYLLGNFGQAIQFHDERLAIAKEFGDKAAERRAFTNLGNAHIFLGEFEIAAEHYKKSLSIAKSLQDRALEAQACYSLGNTYTLLRDYPLAIEYHMRHLLIAQELRDRVGESRAYWSLGNAHSALGNHESALDFANKHLEISKEIGDETGQLTAQMNLTDFRSMLGMMPMSVVSDTSCRSEMDTADVALKRPERARRFSMENMEIMKLTPDKKERGDGGARPKQKVQKSGQYSHRHGPLRPPLRQQGPEGRDEPSSSQQHACCMTESSRQGLRISEIDMRLQLGHLQSESCLFSVSRFFRRATQLSGKSRHRKKRKSNGMMEDLDDDGFFDQLSRCQSRRIDDQRCSFRLLESGATTPTATTPSHSRSAEDSSRELAALVASPAREELMDMVAGLQGSRMNDQRASLPTFPGLNSGDVINQLLTHSSERDVPDDSFFEMLMRCQASRLEDQRSELPLELPHPTVPDEDFFSLIMKVQSSRLDEQRSHLPPSKSTPSTPAGKKKKKGT